MTGFIRINEGPADDEAKMTDLDESIRNSIQNP